MMPPKCRLCDRGHETGDDCELICFARTASDQEWHDWAASPAAIPDHPPDCGWFCDSHVETARSLVHCDLTSALDHVRTHELWHLVYIDLFDRETPPLMQESGVGFESGFIEFWDQMLATIEVNGTRFPSDYRLSFADDGPDYSLERGKLELLTVKQFLSDRDDSSKIERQIAKSQASEMRTHGHPAVAQWLTTLCHQIAEQSEPDLLKSDNS
jgi:hypothetical protein